MHSLQVLLAALFLIIYLLKLDLVFIAKTGIRSLGNKPLSNLNLLVLVALVISTNPVYGVLSLVLVTTLVLSFIVFLNLDRKELSALLIGSFLLLPALYFFKLGGLAVNLSSAVIALFVVLLIRELYAQID
jgi:hypothetical protein